MPYIFLLLVLSFVFYFAYASLIRKQNAVQEAYSGIDVQLTKRHDLIPNLVATAQKFMEHEKTLISEVTALRTQALAAQSAKNVAGTIEAENQLQNKLGQLMVSMEAYPALKSDSTMVEIQTSLNDVEEHIAAARRFYNSSVRVLNDSIRVWPWSMLASALDIREYPMFEASAESKKNVDVGALFKA